MQRSGQGSGGGIQSRVQNDTASDFATPDTSLLTGPVPDAAGPAAGPSPGPAAGPAATTCWLLALVIIAATTAVRWWFVASHQLDLVQDEAQYWDWTRTLQLSYYSKGPLIAWLIKAGTLLLGDTEQGVRVGAVAGSLAMQLLLWFGVAVGFRRPRAALWTLVAANTTPLFMASAVLMTTDNPLLVCWLAALFCLHRAAWARRDTPWLAALGVCMALGVLAKYMMLAFPGVAALYVLALWRAGALRPGFVRRLFAALGLGAVVGFLPILVWNALNGFVGFRHVAGQAGLAEPQRAFWRLDKAGEYFGGQVGLLTPWWLVFLLIGAVRALGGWLAPRRRAGALGAERAAQEWLLAAGFWPVWAFFAVWCFHTRIYANWAAVSYAAGLILAGTAFARLWERCGRWRKVWPALGLAVFVALHLQNWLPLPAEYNPATRLKGWSDLGRQIDALAEEGFDDPARVFHFSEAYGTTAELSFYTAGKNRAYCADFGRRRNQYDLWPGPQDKVGWDAVFVRKGTDQYLPPLDEMFERVEKIEYQTTHRGGPGRSFTIWLCHDFNGRWPAQHGQDF
ncbi:MAG: glycosyltransferase family 39 protein [Desulfovibrionaceae bacterium]|nr:glycosyltransferase family 39 protein [Desulfovibrionaceae bacterium]